MTTLGDLIKKYRKLNNLSMEEFAKRTNLSKSYISILERNKHPRNGNPVTPTLETIKQVASAMQADVNSVLEQIGESDIKVNHVDSNSRPLTPKEKQNPRAIQPTKQ